jgi:hypothetical protein
VPGKKDWRLAGQERYLQGRALKRKRFVSSGPSWDHAHCAFCWEEFKDLDDPAVYREGYCTDDGEHWVCPRCFEDFKARFGWKVVPGN